MRLLVVRSEAELYVKGRASIIIKRENRFDEKHLRDIDSVLIIGSSVKISSSLPPVLSSFNIPLAIVAKNSVSIMINPIVTQYNNYRSLQYRLEPIRGLEIALEYIKSRVNGMVNILKNRKLEIPNFPDPPTPGSEPKVFEQRIRSWESQTSGALWNSMTRLIKPSILEELRNKYEFNGRRPRHRDPFNKTLSIMYAVLYSLGTKALLTAGLDPTSGFLHRTKYNIPLTFDYTEMFKPVAIEATIDMVNEGLPDLNEDGELNKDGVNLAIKNLYGYLTLQHKDTKKSIYQQIFLKAFSLAKFLEGDLKKEKLTIVWNRTQYRSHNKVK
ncbi:CRISPR-associated endonuclease Cas1 [Fervidicoccus fontis]|uniref:CRISPR-associated endonuclease Cas1 n=1 Tax=Fervidicoccus fontis TaxID=683846 RepID=A0A843AAF1_9CREN|nr:CRISPR-associated endonuclease Cas1 [Fervidicoccus fontis]MBE9390812.1 CRISPR-associated endonuclease Cas1 [Fervidicoccus fontis]